MPSPTYAQNKVHIYNWRDKNKEQLKELNRKSAQKFRNWNKIKTEFLNILIE